MLFLDSDKISDTAIRCPSRAKECAQALGTTVLEEYLPLLPMQIGMIWALFTREPCVDNASALKLVHDFVAIFHGHRGAAEAAALNHI